MDNQQSCPFKVGDRVRFVADSHAFGWSWSSFERARLQPRDVGTVTRIENGLYLFLDDERGGFHWECFELLENPTSV